MTIETVEKRWPAHDPQLAVLPVFTQSRPEHQDQIQFLAYFRGPSVRYDALRARQLPSNAALPSAMQLQPQVPLNQTFNQVQLNQTYHDGLTRILKFKASEWPSAQADLAEMIDAAVQNFFSTS